MFLALYPELNQRLCSHNWWILEIFLREFRSSLKLNIPFSEAATKFIVYAALWGFLYEREQNHFLDTVKPSCKQCSGHIDFLRATNIEKQPQRFRVTPKVFSLCMNCHAFQLEQGSMFSNLFQLFNFHFWLENWLHWLYTTSIKFKKTLWLTVSEYRYHYWHPSFNID